MSADTDDQGSSSQTTTTENPKADGVGSENESEGVVEEIEFASIPEDVWKEGWKELDITKCDDES
eukprot:1585174-Rhodomonas_salina.1